MRLAASSFARRLCIACAATATLSFCQSAYSDVEPHSRIVVIADAEGKPELTSATQRLVGELKGAGFDVVVVSHQAGSDARAEVEARAQGSLRAYGQVDFPPFATIALSPAASGATDVWVVDRINQKTVVRRLSNDDTPETVAIHASELLRASLLEIRDQSGKPLPADVSAWLGPPGDHAGPDDSIAKTDSTASSKPVASAKPPASGRHQPTWDDPYSGPEEKRNAERGVKPRGFMMGAGAVALLGYRGFSPAGGPTIDLRYRFDTPKLELVGRVVMPVVSKDISDGGGIGAATLRHGEADLTVMFRPQSDEQTVRPGLGAGLGVYLLDVNGTAFAGQQVLSQHHDNFSFAPSVSADMEFRFADRIRGFVGVSALFLFPEPVVVIEGSDIAQAGEPLFLTTAGLAVAL